MTRDWQFVSSKPWTNWPAGSAGLAQLLLWSGLARLHRLS